MCIIYKSFSSFILFIQLTIFFVNCFYKNSGGVGRILTFLFLICSQTHRHSATTPYFNSGGTGFPAARNPPAVIAAAIFVPLSKLRLGEFLDIFLFFLPQLYPALCPLQSLVQALPMKYSCSDNISSINIKYLYLAAR